MAIETSLNKLIINQVENKEVYNAMVEKGLVNDNELYFINDSGEPEKAPLESPNFTGIPKAPTASADTNTTQIATTAFVKNAIDNINIPNSLPEGGTVGDALVKSPDGGSWETPIEATLVSLPTGILKSDGTTITAATAGVDYHSVTNKYTFTVSDATQSTFTIPFDFNNDSGTLTAYYNGVMMKETDNYTISNNTLTLVDWTAKKGDYLTVMGIEGAASVNVDAKLALIQQAVDKASSDMDSKVASASTDINNKVNSAIKQIDDKLATIPDDVEQAVYKNKSNIMTASGKITMDSTYTPSANGDVVTKKYVDDSAIGLFSSTKNGIVPKSDGSTTKYLRADGSWSTIDKTPVIGTTTDYAIYIGTTQPASGTTPLLWVDTTSSTGYLKYRTSTTGTWTTVPVAWS